jgi:nucleoside-diphosphate-sugar epimerase
VRTLVEAIAAAIDDGALARVDFGGMVIAPHDRTDMFADTSAARELLGYEPAVTLEDGLMRTVAWHRAARAEAAR